MKSLENYMVSSQNGYKKFCTPKNLISCLLCCLDMHRHSALQSGFSISPGWRAFGRCGPWWLLKRSACARAPPIRYTGNQVNISIDVIYFLLLFFGLVCRFACFGFFYVLKSRFFLGVLLFFVHKRVKCMEKFKRFFVVLCIVEKENN